MKRATPDHVIVAVALGIGVLAAVAVIRQPLVVESTVPETYSWPQLSEIEWATTATTAPSVETIQAAPDPAMVQERGTVDRPEPAPVPTLTTAGTSPASTTSRGTFTAPTPTSAREVPTEPSPATTAPAVTNTTGSDTTDTRSGEISTTTTEAGTTSTTQVSVPTT